MVTASHEQGHERFGLNGPGAAGHHLKKIYKVPGGVHKNNDVRLVTIPLQPRHQKSGQKHKLPRAEQILEAAGSGSDMTG